MRTLLVMAACTLPLVAAPVPKTAKKAVSIEGVWEVTGLQSGTQLPQQHKARWTITGEAMNYETTADGKTYTAAADATFVLTRAADDGEACFDYVVNYKDGRKETYPGVVETDGDTLKFCYSISNPRARPVTCKPAEGTVTFLFKRATPNK